LQKEFTEPPTLDIGACLADSDPSTPLIFVLSPGVDPTASLIGLAEKNGMYPDRFQTCSLGQGQAPIATRMLEEGQKSGQWIFLANCHLSLSWMPSLSKIVELFLINKPHPDFRLWLSSDPTPFFPISILQQGIKMTTEPPMGLKANLTRLYQMISEDQFESCQAHEKYIRMVFALSFFHSVMLERRKFGMLGWNKNYPMNDSFYRV
jgi:dynein heavy chain